MWRRLLQQRTLFRRNPRKFTYEPVTHRLNPHPVLPQGMMEAMAPAYEEALAKEKVEREEMDSTKPQE